MRGCRARADDAGMQWDKLNLSALEAIVIKVWPPLSPELFRVPAAVSGAHLDVCASQATDALPVFLNPFIDYMEVLGESPRLGGAARSTTASACPHILEEVFSDLSLIAQLREPLLLIYWHTAFMAMRPCAQVSRLPHVCSLTL